MSTMLDVHTGLSILLKYDPDGEVSAEHDEISFGGGDPEEMSDEDTEQLEKLGFRWNKQYECWAKFT